MTTEDQEKLDHIKKTLEKAKQHCRLILSEEDSRIHYSVWIDEALNKSCKSVHNRLFNMFDIPKAAH